MSEYLERELFFQYQNTPFKHKKHNPLFLIVGKTASGKSTLEAKLNELLKGTPIKSYTTRPPRPGDDTHVFLSPSEFANIKDKLVTYTKIGDYEYGATSKQILSGIAYVIDPVGIVTLQKNGFFKHHDQVHPIVIHLNTPDKIRKERFINRHHDKAQAKKDFAIRENNEVKPFEPLDFVKQHMLTITVDGTKPVEDIVYELGNLYEQLQVLYTTSVAYWDFNTTVADGLVHTVDELIQTINRKKEDELLNLFVKRLNALGLKPMMSLGELPNCTIQDMTEHIEREVSLLEALERLTVHLNQKAMETSSQNQRRYTDALSRFYVIFASDLVPELDQFHKRLVHLTEKYANLLEERMERKPITRDEIPTHIIHLAGRDRNQETPDDTLEISIYIPEKYREQFTAYELQELSKALDKNISTFLENPEGYIQMLHPDEKGNE